MYSLRIKAASPVRPHSPFALISGTKVGQDFLSNVYGVVVVVVDVVVGGGCRRRRGRRHRRGKVC